jgi:hypothetical protein
MVSRVAQVHPYSWSSVMCEGDDCAKLGVVHIGDAGSGTAFDFASDLLARFDFSGRFDGDNYPCVSPPQQTRFQDEFRTEVAKVLNRLREYAWLADDALLPPRVTTGPYQPRTDFHVAVSELYGLSKSLVPAWCGQRGRMEFPAHRVVGGDASLAHEIVHVLFPNGGRMLAEGLAVHLQQELSNVPVYPNYGVDLHEAVVNFLVHRSTQPPVSMDAPSMLWSMNLDAYEQISTPDELGLRIGKDIIGARPGFGILPDDSPIRPDEGKATYEVAGSLVKFLLENPIDDPLLTTNNFGAVYQSTPLRPLERYSGAPERWQKSYLYSFHDLGLLWKTYIHFEFFIAGQKKPVPIDSANLKSPLVRKLYQRLASKREPRARKAK